MLSIARLFFCAMLSVVPALVPLRAHADSARPGKLIVGLLPGESAPTVIRMNQRLREYLERTLGMPVEIQVGSSYAATGEALRFGRIDIAYLGPVTYVLQRQRGELQPFARPSHPLIGPVFEAAIIVPADSPAKTLADLKGADVAFGDPASTSGTWVPQYELLMAGLKAGGDYNAHYLGAHDAVARAVANGKADAGGISKPVYDRLLSGGKIDSSKVRILNISRPIPEYAWTFREGLDADFMAEVTQAFLSITDRDVLKVFHAESFIPARDSDFAPVREWVRALRAERLTQ